MKVGLSDKTKIKHAILNTVLGKITAVSCLPGRTPVNLPIHYIDLCAGTGEKTIHSGTSSMDLFKKHAGYGPLNGRYQITGCEWDSGIFKTLELLYGDNPNTKLLNCDAKEFNWLQKDQDSDQAIVVNIDPNAINAPLLTHAAKLLTPGTTLVCSLGCNPNGYKRDKPRPERDKWFEAVEFLCRKIHTRQDLLLFKLIRNDAQWAYIVTPPKVWSMELRATIVKKVLPFWPNGVEYASLRFDPTKLEHLKLELFLTEKERILL